MASCVQVAKIDENMAALSIEDSLHEPHAFLQRYVNFSEKELAAMEDGKVVAKIFDMGHVENEVGAFGVVRLNIPKKLFVEKFRDIVTFTESDVVEQIGKFSEPPRLEDLQGLTLDGKDLRSLEDCEPGDCKVKLDTAMMERFQKEVDWSSSESENQAIVLMRQFLIDYLNAYLKKGDAALGEYHDQEHPLRIADAFQELLKNAPYLSEFVPELYAYLQNYPNGHLPNVETFFYWSKEQFGLKPVINLFHVTIYTRKHSGSDDVFIISKQIYASHYFETSLGFTAFVDEIGGEDPSNSYLMYLNRSRFDQLRGKLKGLIVTIAKGRVYDGVKKYFRLVKQRLESGTVVKKISKI
jgi:hypothetical protein